MFAITCNLAWRCVARLAALLVIAGVPATAATAASRASCEVRFLEELGWQFEIGPGDQLSSVPGSPCDRASLEDAQRAGDLRVSVPAGWGHDDGRFKAAIAALREDQATLCAWKFRFGAATRTAVDKLVANERFRFSAVQTGWIGFGPAGAARNGWTKVHSWGRGYRPSGSGAQAIAAFQEQPVRAECGVGRQVAQYAALVELFGPEGFDRAFPPEAVLIGTFNTLQRLPNVLLGPEAGELIGDGRAQAASQLGRQAFVGLPGFIFHVYPKWTLSDLNNQAENFVVYDVDADAADALRRHGGFEHYNEQALELWQLAQGVRRQGRRWFERLLHEHDATRRRWLDPEDRAAVARMDEILADPFFRGFQAYVHPKGVKPVGYHFARLLDRNPRTPFRIELGLHNVHTTLFQRYAGQRIQACMASSGTH